MTREQYNAYVYRVSAFLDTMYGEPTCGDWEHPDTDCEPIAFSSRECDVCGSHLAGERHPMIGWTKGAREAGFPDSHKWEGEACPDCVYYCAYGQLDDMTMLELDKVRA